jgi:hypothetical protein
MFSTKDFEKIHWHDNAIHGFRILEGNPCGELVFDIDYIVEWLPPVNGAFTFRVAPSDLMFHEVSNLVISINYEAASAAVQPMSLHEIQREIAAYPNGYSSFIWKLELNCPPDSFFRFCAKGFTQTQRMPPITTKAQWLSPAERTTAL